MAIVRVEFDMQLFSSYSIRCVCPANGRPSGNVMILFSFSSDFFFVSVACTWATSIAHIKNLSNTFNVLFYYKWYRSHVYVRCVVRSRHLHILCLLIWRVLRRKTEKYVQSTDVSQTFACACTSSIRPTEKKKTFFCTCQLWESLSI